MQFRPPRPNVIQRLVVNAGALTGMAAADEPALVVSTRASSQSARRAVPSTPTNRVSSAAAEEDVRTVFTKAVLHSPRLVQLSAGFGLPRTQAGRFDRRECSPRVDATQGGLAFPLNAVQ